MGKKKKKNSKIFFVILLFILTCAGLTTYCYVKWEKRELAENIYYKSFNISIPGNYSVHGIDISTHQGKVQWKRVKNAKDGQVKIKFVFIKATEGLRRVDNQFARNWKEAANVQLPRGAYHFFIATKSGAAQAQNFINTVTLSPGDMPPVLDIENLYNASPENMRKEVKIWLTQVENKYNTKPIIYTYIDFYEKYLGKDFDDYPLWIAHYLQTASPRISRPWCFWQHNENGNINGIRTKVDFNVFNGDSTDFQKLLIK